jgi:hypothetical protein
MLPGIFSPNIISNNQNNYRNSKIENTEQLTRIFPDKKEKEVSININELPPIDDKNINIQQPSSIVELKEINLTNWQQADLNQDSKKVHYVASYYDKKGKRYLSLGTILQFGMLLLSLSGSYIATFGDFNETNKMIMMSALNLSTAIISGVYTFFSFTKKGQSYKEASNILFYKIEKIKLAITTLKNDKEYEDMKRTLIESLLKHDIECIREKYNFNQYVDVYRSEIENNKFRKIKKDNITGNSIIDYENIELSNISQTQNVNKNSEKE